VRFNHLSTPMALTRFGGGSEDVDPKYQKTCKGTSDVAKCIAANIIANLDYGVLHGARLRTCLLRVSKNAHIYSGTDDSATDVQCPNTNRSYL
jgi:hypothetical protein